MLANLLKGLRQGPIAPANPWDSTTLEWTVPSPPPMENFEEIPIVTRGPYDRDGLKESSFHNEFSMNSQQLLFINCLIFVALALFFFLGRPKPQQPTKLNLKAAPKEPDPQLSSEITEKERIQSGKDVTQQAKIPKLVHSAGVFFVYNGHEWEAYEVLGLPKGSSLQTATSHYQNLIKTSDPSTFEFFDAAYSAILKAKHS